MAVWRLQVNTGGENIADYCLKNHVAAMGWSLKSDDISSTERATIQSFQDYCAYAEKLYESFDSVHRMVEDVRPGDLIWMRSRKEGKYYIARVKEDSAWKFNEAAVEIDAANQLTNIDWYLASNWGDEQSVPGAIATSFIKGSTLQRIRKDGVEAYSQMLYNKVPKSALDKYEYEKPKLRLDEKNFYTLLQPEDVEDLLALWLFKTKGYVCIPSTNKIATPKYECVLVDPNDKKRKHIYIQVKKGKVDLDADDYANLKGEVYLLTTEGEVKNDKKYDNIISVSPSDIFEFAMDAENDHIIPENVLCWVKFLAEVEMESNISDYSGCKGIMFDTNITYSDSNETEMLSKNKIAAYGKANRYINSFQKDDYALYYSKGRGIIAVGRIKDDKPSEIGNEKYLNVDMLIPERFSGTPSSLPALSAKEIRDALERNFYWASTIKTPFLSEEQVETLITELKKKYE